MTTGDPLHNESDQPDPGWWTRFWLAWAHGTIGRDFRGAVGGLVELQSEYGEDAPGAGRAASALAACYTGHLTHAQRLLADANSHDEPWTALALRVPEAVLACLQRRYGDAYEVARGSTGSDRAGWGSILSAWCALPVGAYGQAWTGLAPLVRSGTGAAGTWARLVAADLACCREDWGEALTVSGDVLSDPDPVAARTAAHYHARALLGTGRYADLECFALDHVGPSALAESDALCWLAAVAEDQGDADRRLTLLSQAVAACRREQSLLAPWLMYGEALEEAGETKEAVRCYEAGLRLSEPDQVNATRLALASAYFRAGRETRAERTYREVAESGPWGEAGEAWVWIAKLRYAEGDLAEAQRAAEAALATPGGRHRVNALFWLGETHLRRGDYQLALDAFGASLADPYCVRPERVCVAAGEAHLKLREYDEALVALTRSLGDGTVTWRTDALDMAAQAWRAKGREDMAEACLRQALAPPEESAPAIVVGAHASLCESLGYFEEALESYKAATKLYDDVGDLRGRDLAHEGARRVDRIIRAGGREAFPEDDPESGVRSIFQPRWRRE